MQPQLRQGPKNSVEIADMSRSRRRGIHYGTRPKQYHTDKRPDRSPDELLDYLRQHDCHLSRKLMEIRIEGDPTVYDYQRCFKSWGNALKLAFNESVRPNVPAPSRRRMGKRRNKNRPKKYMRRIKFTRNDLIDYMRLHEIRSRKWLCEKNKKSKKKRRSTDPIVYDYVKEFGSWGEALSVVWGREISIEMDARYISRAIAMWGLWTTELYVQKRKKSPHEVPSFFKVISEFGRWSTAVRAARNCGYRSKIEWYMKLWDNIGKMPTVSTAKNTGIAVQDIVDQFGGRKNFYKEMKAERKRSER